MTEYTISMKEFRIYILLIMKKIDEMGMEAIQKLVQ